MAFILNLRQTALCTHKQMFFLDKHGVLRNTKKKEEARTRFVIPEKLRETVMELCRGLPSLAIRVQRELCLRLRKNSIVF
jgi:hypothetical protein